MKKNNKKAYILYQYNDFKKDYEYIMEYYNIKELEEKNNIKLKNDRSIYHYIKKQIQDNMQLLNDKYIIIQEDL